MRATLGAPVHMPARQRWSLHASPYWQVFSAPWRQRKTEKAYGFLLTVTVLLVACWVAVAVISRFDRKPMVLGFAFLFCFELWILWMMQFAAYMQYNRPACVLTVPRYLTVQRRTMLATWCVVVGLQTATWIVCKELGVIHITASSWHIALAFGAINLLFPVLLRWTFATGVVMVSGMRWPDSWTSWLNAHWPTEQRWALWDSGDVLTALAALTVMAWLLTKVMRPGNAAHRAAYQRLHTIMHSKPQAPIADGHTTKRPGGLIAWLHRHIFNWHANRILPRSGNHASTPLARAELAFGPGWLWWNQLATPVVMASIFGICLVVLIVLLGHEGKLIGREVFTNPAAALFVATLVWFHFMVLPFLLTHTRREQALMVLLPGLPTGQALARQMATRLVRRAAVTWLCMALVLWGLPAGQATQPLSIALCLVTLQIIPFMIRDWSRMSAADNAMTMPSICLIAAIGLALLLYNAIIPTTLAVTVALACFAANLAWRWHRLAGYPQPLPVGRSAQQGK